MVISPVHFPTYTFKPRHARGNSFFDPARYFSRGSWALAHGITAVAIKRGKNTARAWLPDYFCKEPLEILKCFPIEVGYYPIGKNLEPDWQALEKMCERQGIPDAMVLVHYFGFPNDLTGAKAFCEKYGIELIEDCAHVMAPFGDVGISGSFSIWSPWKFFPIPLLGVLRAREGLYELVPALAPRQGILSGIRWYLKREIQRALCTIGVNWYVSTAHNSTPPPLILRGGIGRHASSDMFSLRLFEHYRGQAEYIRMRRRVNYKALETFLKERYPKMMLSEKLPENATPYLFPLVLKGPAQKYVDELVCRGIPATKWPALPDKVQGDPQRFEWAHFYAEHLMVLSIHQNISQKQIEYMTRQIATILPS